MSDTVNQATESAPEKRPLRVLVVEDSEFDARMLVGLLKAGGFEPEFRRVETAPQMSAARFGRLGNYFGRLQHA